MLPEPYRLHHHTEFSRTVRRGHRIGRRDLVVHCYFGTHTGTPGVAATGPRFGLIVSKAVGNAVIRHRVARRLRHICAPLAAKIPAGTDVVIRALPGAADAASAELARQIEAGLHKAGAL